MLDPRLSRVGSLIVVIGALLLAAAPAGAAAPWSPPVDVFGATAGDPGFSGSQPSVAVDHAGGALAVWSAGEGPDPGAQAAFRPAGGPWQAPVALSPPGEQAGAPALAVDAQDGAVAAWVATVAGGTQVRAAYRPAGGPWQAATDVSVVSTTLLTDPQVHFDADRAAILQWKSAAAGGSVIEHGAVRSAGGTWSALDDVEAPDADAGPVDVVFSANGAAAAVWLSDDGAAHAKVRAATRQANGTWGTITDLSATLQRAGEPRLVVDAAGNETAVWSGDGGTGFIAQAAVRPAGGSWQAPVDLSERFYAVSTPELAVDDQGDAFAVWNRWDRTTFGSTDFLVQGAFRPVGGSWQERTDLSAAGEPAGQPRLAVDVGGDALAVWDATPGDTSLVRAARRSAAGGGWQASTVVSGPGDQASRPAAALDGGDTTITVFKRARPADQGGGFVVQASGVDDGTSPQDTVTIPTPPAAPPSPTSGPITGAGTPPTLRPVLSGVRVTHRRFRVAEPGTALSAATPATPRGTTFLLALSTRATVTIAIRRTVAGLRRGVACVTPTAALRRSKARRCTHVVTVATLRRADLDVGAHGIAFSGRVVRRALTPGSYVATLTAANAAGRSTAVRLAIAVVKGGG